MKKIFLLLVTALTLTSCTEDVKFNNPSLQASNGDKLFRATDPTATLQTDGSILLEGNYRLENLNIKLTSLEPGTYKFGVDTNTVANYRYTADGMVFEYSTLQGPSNPNMQSDLGEIVIFDAENPKASKEPNTISGTFYFNGKLTNENPFAQPNIFLEKGHFYGLKIKNAEPQTEQPAP